jgi:hypothetical protein
MTEPTHNIAFLTYDLELTETSLRSQAFSATIVEREIVTPLTAQLEWARQLGIESTMFVELGQFVAIRKHWPELFQTVVSLLNHAREQGLIDLQLHVHPNWDADNGIQASNGRVRLGIQSYDYVCGRESQVVSNWIEQFESLFGVGPTAFRSGKYRAISGPLRDALVDHGIRVFSSSIQGAILVSDNGDITDYREISELLPVMVEARGDDRICEVPVTARGGRALSPDYSGTAMFSKLVERMAYERVPLCLVSHHKNLRGAFYDIHRQNVMAMRRAGYHFARLRYEFALAIAANHRPVRPRFSESSESLLQRVSRCGTLSCDARTPFPAWVLQEMIHWQRTTTTPVAPAAIATLSVSRGIVLRRFWIRGTAPDLIIVLAPRWTELIPRLKYLARRVVLLAPWWLHAGARRLWTGSVRRIAPGLDLFRFLAPGSPD